MKRFRFVVTGILQVLLLTGLVTTAQAQPSLTGKPNLALVAKISSSRGGFGMEGLNDQKTPVNTGNNRGGFNNNNNRPPRANIWVQYEWQEPVSTSEVALFWWNFNNNVRCPNNTAFLTGTVPLLYR